MAVSGALEAANGETASLKSWALRLSSQAASADDPNFLDFNLTSSNQLRFDSESLSHRFWVNGCLSYCDKIFDGFYLIHGLDPYAWNISTDQGSSGRVPSLESLKAIEASKESSVVVVLVDKSKDPGLNEVQNWVQCLSGSWGGTIDVIRHLANLVCSRMGGPCSNEEELTTRWKQGTDILRDCLSSIVIPIGYLSIGLCVHRALLFKILANLVNLPCRIVKGCKYCNKDVGASCLVQFGSEREYLVDLLGSPGVLSQPDSSFNSSLSILVSSPLCHPKFKSGAGKNPDEKEGPRVAEIFGKNFRRHESSAAPFHHRAGRNSICTDHRRLAFSDPSPNTLNSTLLANDTLQQPVYYKAAPPDFSNRVPDTTSSLSSSNRYHLEMDRPSHDFYLAMEESDIQWNELLLIKKIGSGSFGTVYHASWCGSEVAVKILKEQDFVANNFQDFLKEVTIMKRLRHPNIVSFLGAITQPPNLSIVTEYLSNGCLYKLLRRSDAGAILDERLRLNMAYDVAKGMNYLHQLQPPIVHRDLKSPNLLVDGKFTVKVCDFGLSRSKANTFLSSKTAAGTPEWMAPEVLRDELSNEKADVYSFGVILWELMTLRLPWSNLSSNQVVAAVGFKNMRLEIPTNVNPQIAALIEICWENEPSRRPSFSYIMEALQQLIRNCSCYDEDDAR